VASAAKPVDAPVLSYEPPMPRDKSIAIGLIGAAASACPPRRLQKYGLNVVAICDRISIAGGRGATPISNAVATDKLDDVIGRHDIPVLDLTVHAKDRVALMRVRSRPASTCCRRKPFVRDLIVGANWSRSPTAKACSGGQPERPLAPHLSWIRERCPET